MAARKKNSVACVDCKLTITEPKSATAIREKLRGIGWRFWLEPGGETLGRCLLCHAAKHGECCKTVIPSRFEGNLKDMQSPWMKQ